MITPDETIFSTNEIANKIPIVAGKKRLHPHVNNFFFDVQGKLVHQMLFFATQQERTTSLQKFELAPLRQLADYCCYTNLLVAIDSYPLAMTISNLKDSFPVQEPIYRHIHDETLPLFYNAHKHISLKLSELGAPEQAAKEQKRTNQFQAEILFRIAKRDLFSNQANNDAIHLCYQAIKKNNEEPLYYEVFNRLLLNRNMVYFPNAIDFFRRACALRPSSTNDNHLAIYFIMKQQWQQAQSQLNNMLQQYPTRRIVTLKQLAWVATAQQNWRYAIVLRQEILSLEPSSAQHHYTLGKLLLNTHAYKEAITHLQQGTSLAPTKLEYRLLLAQTLHQVQDYQKEEQQLDVLLQVNHLAHRGDIVGLAIENALCQGNMEKAVRLMERYMLLPSKLDVFFLNLASWSQQMDDLSSARHYALLAYNYFPSDNNRQIDLARLLANCAPNAPQTIACLRKVINNNSTQTDLHRLLAHALYQQGHKQEAFHPLTCAISLGGPEREANQQLLKQWQLELPATA